MQHLNACSSTSFRFTWQLKVRPLVISSIFVGNWAALEWPQHSQETFQIYRFLCCVGIAIQKSLVLLFFSLKKYPKNHEKLPVSNNLPTWNCQDICTVIFVASVQQKRWMYFLACLWGWSSSSTPQSKNNSTGSVEARLSSPDQVNVVMFFMQLGLVPLHCIPQYFLEGSLPWAQRHMNMFILFTDPHWHCTHSCCSEPKLNLHWLSVDQDTNNAFPAFSLSPPLLVNGESTAFAIFIQ